MRALFRGDRNASLLGLLVLFGLLCLSATGLILAWHSQHVLKEFTNTVYQRCLQRQAQDQSTHDAVVANEELYERILALGRLSPDPPTPQAAELNRQYVQALETARDRNHAAAQRGVIGSCTVYK